MTKQKAIGILKKQIVKLEGTDDYLNSWIIQTNTYLSAMFGATSEQSNYFFSSFFDVHVWDKKDATKEDIENEFKSITLNKKSNAVNFLNECIDTIYDIGLHKPKKTGNILTNMPDKWVVTIITGLIGFAFYIGTISCKL